MSAPDQAPAGVQIQFLPRPSTTGPYAAAWSKAPSWFVNHPAPQTVTEARPKITPRLIIVHTNGASGTGSIASAFSWAMRDPNYTKPHYQVDLDGSAAKFLPSDRKGIGNGSVAAKTGGKMAADFSLVIETADLGYGAGKPGQAAEFTPQQVETVAQIIAYEAKLWGIPIEYPDTWDGAGVACHTEPFGYPYWTIDAGHVCPGWQKKLDMVTLVMPRARQILGGTPPPPPPPPPPPILIPVEDNMKVISPNTRPYDSRNDSPLVAGQIRTIYLGSAADGAQAAQVNLTAIGLTQPGYIVAFGEAAAPPTSNVNFSAGQVQANAAIVKVTGSYVNVLSNVACHIVIDLQAVWP